LKDEQGQIHFLTIYLVQEYDLPVATRGKTIAKSQ